MSLRGFLQHSDRKVNGRRVVNNLAFALRGIARLAEWLNVINGIRAAERNGDNMINGKRDLGFAFMATRALMLIKGLQIFPFLRRPFTGTVAPCSPGFVLNGPVGRRVLFSPARGGGTVLVAVLLAPCSATFLGLTQEFFTVVFTPFLGGTFLDLWIFHPIGCGLGAYGFLVLLIVFAEACMTTGLATRIQAILMYLGVGEEFQCSRFDCTAFRASLRIHKASVTRIA